ncbi:MAG: ParB/RepB/Spo0J family partition protein [Rickettsiaceae bacterium H1]|nr:ParB/RepB/Spo0J family partition protein [Rickettsiaceae bacterium H1]
MNKLGKGLSALIPDNINVTNKKIKLTDLCPGKYQHRMFFNDDKLWELAISIKNNGVIQPIIVRKKTDSDKYEIIAGERRTKASKIAKLSEIPAIVLDIDDKAALEISIIENVQRDDLSIIEEAEGYKNLIDEFDYSQDKVAKIVGKSRTHVTNCLRMLSLPNEIQNIVKKKYISAGHGRALIGVKNHLEIVNKIIKKGLTVRETEALVKKITNKRVHSEEKDKDIVRLEEQISEKLGLPIKINDNKKTGSVVITFKNLQELNLILKRLSINLTEEIDIKQF